jgi:hypothetical protein
MVTMTDEPVPVPPIPPALLPDPDALRDAIARTDERARLLRQLLRAALRLEWHTRDEAARTRRQAKGGRADV